MRPRSTTVIFTRHCVSSTERRGMSAQAQSALHKCIYKLQRLHRTAPGLGNAALYSILCGSHQRNSPYLEFVHKIPRIIICLVYCYINVRSFEYFLSRLLYNLPWKEKIKKQTNTVTERKKYPLHLSRVLMLQASNNTDVCIATYFPIKHS